MIKLFRIALAVLTVLIFSFWNPKEERTDCRIAHNGTFKYGGIFMNVVLEIHGSVHKEFYEDGKYFVESEIVWLNECEYKTKIAKFNMPDFPFSIGDVMKVKITKVVGDEIYYTSSIKDKTWEGKFIRIK